MQIKFLKNGSETLHWEPGRGCIPDPLACLTELGQDTVHQSAPDGRQTARMPPLPPLVCVCVRTGEWETHFKVHCESLKVGRCNITAEHLPFRAVSDTSRVTFSSGKGQDVHLCLSDCDRVRRLSPPLMSNPTISALYRRGHASRHEHKVPHPQLVCCSILLLFSL